MRESRAPKRRRLRARSAPRTQLWKAFHRFTSSPEPLTVRHPDTKRRVEPQICKASQSPP